MARATEVAITRLTTALAAVASVNCRSVLEPVLSDCGNTDRMMVVDDGFDPVVGHTAES